MTKWKPEMSLRVKLLHRLGRMSISLGKKLLNHKETSGIWIDVGAHLGEKTFGFAQRNSSLIVYAFEPILNLATQKIGLLPNFVVIPMAIAEHDGSVDFHLNSFDAASSILPFNPDGLTHWIGGNTLQIESIITVPTIRLDTFMNRMGISHVDYLKIDAQGMDFFVIKSAGNRLKDIRKITLEVAITPVQLYAGAANKEEIIDYLEKAGFVMVEAERQTYDQEENLTFVRDFL